MIDWDTLQGAGRWENPLMGWASSGDYMQGTQMAFPTKEEAIAFVSFVLFPLVSLVSGRETVPDMGEELCRA